MIHIEQIKSALSCISPVERDTWIKVGMAIQSELGDSGFYIWDDWSQTADSYNHRDAESVWKSFSPGGGINIGSFFHLAQQSGWEWQGASLTEEEITKQRANIEAQNEEAEEQRREKQAKAAGQSQSLWKSGYPADNNPYLNKKGCVATVTLKHLPIDDVVRILGYHPKSKGELLEGKILLVPVVVNGEISTIEMIDEKGRKSAVAGGKKSGGYWAAQQFPAEFDGTLTIAEGVATSITVKQATGHIAVAALSCHNLVNVAKQLKERYPRAKIIILADSGNGQKGAEKAAIETDSLLVVPKFTENTNGTDFNDLAAVTSLEEVKRQVGAAIKPINSGQSAGKCNPHSAPEKFSTEAKVNELAKMSPLEYDKVRKEVADELGVRITTLDREVKNSRKKNDEEQTGIFPIVDPWHEAVNGESLIRELAETYTRHSVLPAGSAFALALWTILTYCYGFFKVLPILLISSPEKRCGKSTLMTTLAGLANRVLTASNISPAAMFRSVEVYNPTLLIDEGDTFLKANDDLRGIINSGHTKTSAYVIRCDGEDNEPKRFSTWCPKALAMIGNPPDTVFDRSVVVPLRRKLAGETVVPHTRESEDYADELRQKITRFVEDNEANIRGATPPRLPTANDRQADNWAPLLAIATSISDSCLQKAIVSAVELAGDVVEEDPPSAMLLSDIRDIMKGDRISSDDLVKALVDLDDAPWCEWKHGKPMTKNSLARLLKPFKIKSKTIRVGNKTFKGYMRDDFDDAFSRYLPIQNVTASQVNNISKLGHFQSVTHTTSVTFKNQPKSLKSNDCYDVTFQNGDTPEHADNPTIMDEDDFIFEDQEVS